MAISGITTGHNDDPVFQLYVQTNITEQDHEKYAKPGYECRY